MVALWTQQLLLPLPPSLYISSSRYIFPFLSPQSLLCSLRNCIIFISFFCSLFCCISFLFLFSLSFLLGCHDTGISAALFSFSAALSIFSWSHPFFVQSSQNVMLNVLMDYSFSLAAKDSSFLSLEVPWQWCWWWC